MPSRLPFKKPPGRMATTEEMTITARCIMARGGRASDVAKLFGVQNIQAQRIIAGTKDFNPGPSLDAQPLPGQERRIVAPSNLSELGQALGMSMSGSADPIGIIAPRLLAGLRDGLALVIKARPRKGGGYTDYALTVRVFDRKAKRTP
jgi:hypothetical protein